MMWAHVKLSKKYYVGELMILLISQEEIAQN